MRALMIITVLILVGCSNEDAAPAETPAADTTFSVEDVGEQADAVAPTDTKPAPDAGKDPVLDVGKDTAVPPVDGCIDGCPEEGFASCGSDGLLRICEVAADGCLDFGAPDDCDDADPCTTDACEDAQCTHTSIQDCCEPDCPEPICDAGTTFCSEGQGFQCSADGMQQSGLGPCCEPNVSVCLSADVAQSCPSGPHGLVQTDCGSFETCLQGGCVEVLAWSPGDTEEDTQIFFLIHAAICSLMAPADDGVCFAIDSTQLQWSLDTPGLTTFWCDGDFGPGDVLPYGNWSEDDVSAAVDALIPCGGSTPALDFAAAGGSLPVGGTANAACIGYSDGTVTVGPCP
ncbi:MAG: hypothetical protein ACI9WU_003677 [Myxococcota bacterium]|jgi:hypothetical protein